MWTVIMHNNDKNKNIKIEICRGGSKAYSTPVNELGAGRIFISEYRIELGTTIEYFLPLFYHSNNKYSLYICSLSCSVFPNGFIFLGWDYCYVGW